MVKEQEQCVASAKGPIVPKQETSAAAPMHEETRISQMIAQVGKLAPDFEAIAFIDGGFNPVKLSGILGNGILGTPYLIIDIADIQE